MAVSKILVGMSGGVDSAAAAYLLKKDGHRVLGVTLELYGHPRSGSSGAPDRDNATSRARDICDRLGIEHLSVDARGLFDSEVVEPFVNEYRSGRTPNPCVICNEKIKFPILSSLADRHGCASIATGHYARLIRKSRGRLYLGRGADRGKDQSDFLYRVQIGILDRTLFPLGGLRKEEVTELVAGIGLVPAGTAESQDTCFLAGRGLHRFLEERDVDRPGRVIGPDGETVGEHKGISYYTLGQRKGLGIAGDTPLYISSIDADRNVIELAPDGQLYVSRILCRRIKLRSRKLEGTLTAKIRYGHRPAPVESVEIGKGSIIVSFCSPQRAATPGQSLVLYSDGLVIGGGIIEKGIR